MGSTDDSNIVASTLTTLPISKNTNPSSKNTEDNDKTVVIVAVVGTLFVVVILFVVIAYIYTKKKRPSRKKYTHRRKDKWKNEFNFEQTASLDHDVPQPSKLGFGYENEALQKSNQDIERGNEYVSNIETNALVSHQRSDSPPYNIGRSLSGNSFDVSIKLLTPWSNVYDDVKSIEYSKMKECVEQSVDDLYMNFDDYKSTSVLRFREGSLLCDMRLLFYKEAVDPLSLIENAVADGILTNLEVDKKYFVQLTNSNQENIFEETDPLAMSSLSDSAIAEVRKRQKNENSQNKDNRIESGYGSQYFDPKQVVAQLSRHKMRENSQKSVRSIDSVISDTSPKSLSSTNVSIHDQAELEIEKQERNSQLKNIFRSLGKSESRKQKHKLHSNKEGGPYVALFDFAPQDSRELSLKYGEMVNVLCISSGGWVKVVNESGAKGWVPQKFVVRMDRNDLESTRKAVESIIYLDEVIDSIDNECVDKPDRTPPSHHGNNRNHGNSGGSLSNDDDEEDDHDYEILEKESETDEEDVSNLFITMFPFEPTEKKELGIEIGDLIDVIQTSETGWWKGVCLRSQEEGWFPSSYVKPQSADVDFTEFLPKEDTSTKSSQDESVSEKLEEHSLQREDITDSRSDDGGSIKRNRFSEKGESPDKSKVKRKLSDDNSVYRSNKLSGISDDSELDYRKGIAGFRPLHDVSKDISKSENFIYSHLQAPSKPVPPKPRKRHIQEVVRLLAAEGKLLGSTESLTTRSNENLTQYRHYKRTAQNRRNSDGYFEDDETALRRGFVPRSGVTRARPKSYQETPKASFLHLANRYAELLKPAWSLPALNMRINDQIKLSPDDERPYLEPIPRKPKRTNPESEKVDLTNQNIIYTDSTLLSNDNASSEPSESGIAEHFANKPLPSSPKPKSRKKVVAEKPNIPKRITAKKMNTKKFIEEQLKLNKEKSAKGRGNIGEHMLPPRTTSNINCRVRGNHRPFARFESTIFEESENMNSPSEDKKAWFTRSQEDLSTLVKDEKDKLDVSSPTEKNDTSHFHRRYHSEPYQGDVCVLEKGPSRTKDNISYQKSPSDERNSKLHFNGHSHQDTELHEPNALSLNSRTSSIQSLTSVASSARSTASSRPEQMNLRRAIVNVYGQGSNDLTFKVGSMLYELRPRNKEGLCFGLLEDSTQGWYPAEAVEQFYDV